MPLDRRCEIQNCNRDVPLKTVHFLAPNAALRRRTCDDCYARLQGLVESGMTQSSPANAENDERVLAFASRVHLELFLHALDESPNRPSSGASHRFSR